MEEIEIVLEKETNSEIEINLESEGKEIFPSLEDLTIIPQTEQQVFTHENSYGYDKVTVERVPLQNKEITPTKETQTITSDYDYFGLDEVTVNPIPDEYIVPNLQDKEVTITKNGTQDITFDSGYNGLKQVNITVDVAGGSSDTMYTEEGYIKYGLVSWWEGCDELDENYRWLSRIGNDYISQYKPTLKTDGSNSFGNIKTADAYVNNKTYGLVTSKDYWGEDYTIEVVGKVNSQNNSNNSSGGTLLAFDKQVSPMIQIWGTNNVFGCLNQNVEQDMPYLFKDCLGKRYKYTIALREVPSERQQSGETQISYALNDIGWYTRSTLTQYASNCRPNLTILCYYRDSYMSDAEINSIRIYNRRLSIEELKHNYEIDKARFNLDTYEK